MTVRSETTSERFFHCSLLSAWTSVDLDIERLYSGGSKPGWKDRVVTGLIMLSAYNETLFNSVGVVKSKGCVEFSELWEKTSGSGERLKLLRKRFTPSLEANQIPFLSVNELRELRNDMLHASPELDHEPRVRVMEFSQDEEQDLFATMNHSVEQRISLEEYRRFRDDSKQFGALLLKGAGLKEWDLNSKTHGSEIVIE